MLKRNLIAIAIISLALVFSANAFGQNQRKKKIFHNLPEVGDEVLVAFRKKQAKHKISHRTKSTKRRAKPFFDEADALFGKRQKSTHNRYANQEVSYLKKPKLKKIKGVTHDPEFENWANRKHKSRKMRKQ